MRARNTSARAAGGQLVVGSTHHVMRSASLNVGSYRTGQHTNYYCTEYELVSGAAAKAVRTYSPHQEMIYR